MSQFQSLEEARTFFQKDRYATENGIVLEEFTKDGSVCSVELTDRHRNAEGGVMGGVMLTLIDFAFATAARSFGSAGTAVVAVTLLASIFTNLAAI